MNKISFPGNTHNYCCFILEASIRLGYVLLLWNKCGVKRLSLIPLRYCNKLLSMLFVQIWNVLTFHCWLLICSNFITRCKGMRSHNTLPPLVNNDQLLVV